jgi:hypothetical protein
LGSRRQKKVSEQVKEVLEIEAQGIMGLVDRIGPEFEEAVRLILRSKGRVGPCGQEDLSHLEQHRNAIAFHAPR